MVRTVAVDSGDVWQDLTLTPHPLSKALDSSTTSMNPLTHVSCSWVPIGSVKLMTEK